MTKQTFTQKNNGDTLSATEWNNLTSYINTAVDAINAGGGSSSGGSTDSHISFDSTGKHNLTIQTTAADQYTQNGSTKGGKINVEAVSDIQLKPGDDIILYSHHRPVDKQDEVSVKVTDGNDVPVKLQVNTADIVLTTKDKATKSDELNIAVNSNTNTRGYLKVRAQAIDLRCEKHGGVALQPKGYDSEGHMNKIKFEHGGGDGLEFGTFNTEKTSIFTNEYRFNKDGIWKMATRETTESGKTIQDEKEGGLGNLPATGALKYVKQADDFYDIINVADATCTTSDIIATAHAMNNDHIETALSNKNNLKISAVNHYKFVVATSPAVSPLAFEVSDVDGSYTKDDLKVILDSESTTKLSDLIETKAPFVISGTDNTQYVIVEDVTPKISIESEEEVDLDAKYGDVVITSGDTIKCEAPEVRLNAIKEDKTGGVVNFGATQDVMFINSKLTKGLKVEASATPTKIEQVLQNNSADTVYWDETESIFRVPMKHIYADAEHTIEITPSNYSTYKEKAAYFADGTLIPADYTCFGYVTTEDNGTYTTNVYKYSTKGSSAVLSKNYKQVGQYTSTTEGVLGSRVTLGTADELTTLEFELPSYTGDTNISAVQPEEFVTVAECELGDIIALVNYMKTNNQGPWTGTNS